jgi:hypothetical protein
VLEIASVFEVVDSWCAFYVYSIYDTDKKKNEQKSSNDLTEALDSAANEIERLQGSKRICLGELGDYCDRVRHHPYGSLRSKHHIRHDPFDRVAPNHQIRKQKQRRFKFTAMSDSARQFDIVHKGEDALQYLQDATEVWYWKAISQTRKEEIERF